MKGKKASSGRSYESFCNRYNVIIQELRVGVMGTIHDEQRLNGEPLSEGKPLHFSIFAILDEILRKTPVLGKSLVPPFAVPECVGF